MIIAIYITGFIATFFMQFLFDTQKGVKYKFNIHHVWISIIWPLSWIYGLYKRLTK